MVSGEVNLSYLTVFKYYLWELVNGKLALVTDKYGNRHELLEGSGLH